MSVVPVSVVVVSRGRPDALSRCLKGLAQLDYPTFEIVVVCDPVSARAVTDPLIRQVPFHAANISAARNAGVAQAAGDIVAFIDDDAVPEPTWLSHLIAPFAHDRVAAAGGYTRGRNGITFQWRGRMVFADGRSEELPIPGDRPVLFPGQPGEAIHTQGTNMAMRRQVLVDLGGFDAAYRFYLDETDLNMRLGEQGLTTAIVPLAQVHHGFAASDRRRTDRVPRRLFEVAASIAVFAAKFGGTGNVEAARHAARTEQRQRLLRHMIAGRLMPGDVRWLLGDFDAGWQDGLGRTCDQYPDWQAPPTFQPFPSRFTGHVTLHERFWRAGSAKERARGLVAEGRRVTLVLLSASALYHRVRFHPDGYWLQTGGQFGRSDRRQPAFRFWPAAERVAAEKDRVMAVRSPKS